MNLTGLFQEFNPSKFLVYSSVLAFSILLELRLDNHILWSYWVLFTPIWIWKLIVIVGALSGTFIWIHHPEYRREGSVDLHAMLIALFFHMLLLVSELLLCSNLEGYSNLPYRIVFIPLYIVSSLSIAGCIWGFRHDRSLEFETVFLVNLLQIICISLKLDRIIKWKWVVVFVPTWIVLTLICLIVLYYVIWVALFLRSPEITARQRRGHLIYATLSCCMMFPLLSFIVALTRRLDSTHGEMYATVLIPLQIAIFSLIVTSFYQKGGNPWWFGVRKEFCVYLLDVFPCLKEYGNVSYKFSDTVAWVDAEDDADHAPRRLVKLEASAAGSSLDFIDMPD